jgi:PAS domain S-box-containing protein
MKKRFDIYKMLEKPEKDFMRLLSVYQKAIDHSVICSITDVDGVILYANDKFCEVSQFSKEELVGQKHNIVSSGFHSKEFFVNMWDTIRGGNIWQGEVKSKAKDDTYFWLDSTIFPIFDENGNVMQFFSLRLPIDEKKKAEEEKKEHIQSLEEMLFMTSHKVRQPIANILGLANQMEDCIDSKEELKEMIGYMKESVLSLDLFTRELTTLIYETKKREQTYDC